MPKIGIRTKFTSKSKLLRKINHNPNLSPLEQIEDKPVFIRKSKTHLTGMITSPYAIQNSGTLQGQIKSKSKASLGAALKQKIALQTSLSLEMKSSLHQSFSNSLIEDYKGNYDKADRLLSKFNKMIKANNLKKTKEENINVCRLILDELISYEKAFAPLLEKIKDQYEIFIKDKVVENESIQCQIKEFNTLNSLLSSEVSKLLEEREELMSKYNSCNNISSKAADIMPEANQNNDIKENYDISYLKKLSEENQVLNEAFGSMQQDLKYYKNISKELTKLLLIIKKKGYPIEEIYNTEVKKKKTLPHYLGDEGIPDDTDTENIITPKPSTFQRPNYIPALNFSLVEPNSFTSESGNDSDELSDRKSS